jgi:hypothetical protein
MVRLDPDRIGQNPDEHVEIDESWVGGKTRGLGRGVHDQTLVIAAVEVRRSKPKGNGSVPRRHGRYAGRIRLEVISDHSAATLIPFIRGAVEPGAQIVRWVERLQHPDRERLPACPGADGRQPCFGGGLPADCPSDATHKNQQQQQKTAGKPTLDHKMQTDSRNRVFLDKSLSVYNATNDHMNAVLGIDFLVHGSRYFNLIRRSFEALPL